MVKLFVSVFVPVICLFLLVSPGHVFSQTPSAYPQYYKDYTYQLDLYRQAHSDYLTTRQAYLTYQTLTSKSEAQDKTLLMLKLRDETIRTYMVALNSKVNSTPNIGSETKNPINTRLVEEADWYYQHQNSLPSAGTLEDLVDSSQDTESRFVKTTILSYQSLISVLSGKENTLRSQLVDQTLKIKSKLAEIRINGDKDTTKAERWLLEAENRITRSQQKQVEAFNIINKLATSTDNTQQQEYNKAQFAIEESHQYLKETNSYLKEVILEIKSADPQ